MAGTGKDIGDFPGFRESPELLLREDQLIAVSYLEDAAPAFDHPNLLNPVGKRVFQLCRHTGGLLVVPSRDTVFDAQIQRFRHCALQFSGGSPRSRFRITGAIGARPLPCCRKDAEFRAGVQYWHGILLVLGVPGSQEGISPSVRGICIDFPSRMTVRVILSPGLWLLTVFGSADSSFNSWPSISVITSRAWTPA